MVWDLQHYETKKGSPVGARITFVLNSYDIVKRHPLVGVGTGDYVTEYAKVDARTTKLGATTNPHNRYTLEAVQFGIVLPVIFAVIMLSDTYLRGFFTTMLFVYLSTFTYRLWPEPTEE